MYSEDAPMNPVSGMSGLSTEHATAGVVIGALLLLVAIRRGFRGVSVGGVGFNVR